MARIADSDACQMFGGMDMSTLTLRQVVVVHVHVVIGGCGGFQVDAERAQLGVVHAEVRRHD